MKESIKVKIFVGNFYQDSVYLKSSLLILTGEAFSRQRLETRDSKRRIAEGPVWLSVSFGLVQSETRLL